MVSEKDTDPPKNGVGHPPQPRPLIIRIFRAFKRYESRRRRQNREYAKQHPFYEMMMARWTRRVGIYTFGLILVGLLTCYVIWNQLQSSELEQRPWLNFSSFEINAGFTVDNENVYFDTKYSLVNT